MPVVNIAALAAACAILTATIPAASHAAGIEIAQSPARSLERPRPLAAAQVPAAPTRAPAERAAEAGTWPEGAQIVRFENLEGMALLTLTLTGANGRDTTGAFVLDTGAGYLAIDLPLARHLGLTDSLHRPEAVDLTARPLPRMTLGEWSLDQVQPVLTVDASIVRRITDRSVLGLLGHRPLRDRAIWLDFGRGVAALVPVDSKVVEYSEQQDDGDRGIRSPETVRRSRERLSPLLSARAVPVPFRLAGDGKMVVRGRVSDPRPPARSGDLNLIVDTGATKCVLFEDALRGAVRHASAWPALAGLMAPTLIGAADARIARIPAMELDAVAGHAAVRRERVDTGLIRSELSRILSHVTRTTIHGLIGYSFLKHFRIAIDYPDRILWLDPLPRAGDERPHEYSHVGLQLERHEGTVRVASVAERSPAARAGIERDDQLVALDGIPAATLDLIELVRRMEGPPGSTLILVTRRGDAERTHRLVRRRLL